MTYTTGNNIVDAVGKINFTGNVIPHSWYSTIVKENGKPHLTAIVLLADIVYWYKPKIIRDENTGQIVQIRKKFKADLLQRNYQQFSELFGISKREATNAIVSLEEKRILKRVFRTLNANGMTINNVLFIELNVDKLIEYTYPCEKDAGVTFECDTLSPKKGIPTSNPSNTYPLGNSIGATLKGETNTEITQETTTGDFTSYQEVSEAFKKSIDYVALACDYSNIVDRLDEIVLTAVDILTSTNKSIRVNQEDKPVEVVKGMFWKLNMFHIQQVLNDITETRTPIKNMRAVIITSLYNIVLTHSNSIAHKVASYMEGM